MCMIQGNSTKRAGGAEKPPAADSRPSARTPTNRNKASGISRHAPLCLVQSVLDAPQHGVAFLSGEAGAEQNDPFSANHSMDF